MADVVFVAILIIFFGVCVALVRACERIIGTEDMEIVAGDAEPEEAIAA